MRGKKRQQKNLLNRQRGLDSTDWMKIDSLATADREGSWEL